MDFEKFCSQILDVDPKIRFATVFDEWSVKVGGGIREGVESLLSERASKELVNLAILDWKSRKDMVNMLGKTKYVLAEYDRIKRFSFYLGDNSLLLVSAEKDCDTNLIVDQVIKLYYKNQD